MNKLNINRFVQPLFHKIAEEFGWSGSLNKELFAPSYLITLVKGKVLCNYIISTQSSGVQVTFLDTIKDLTTSKIVGFVSSKEDLERSLYNLIFTDFKKTVMLIPQT